MQYCDTLKVEFKFYNDNIITLFEKHLFEKGYEVLHKKIHG